MACVCENYIVKCVGVNPCNSGTWLGITPDEGESGTWLGVIYFNGAKTEFGLEVEVGEEISILTTLLNENYVHEFRLYNTLGELFGCYKLHTTYTRNVSGAPVPPVDTGAWDWHSLEMPGGNDLVSVYFTGDLSPIIWLASNPIEWEAAGITQDAATGTLNLTAIGGFEGTISFQYRNLAE